MIDPYEKYAPKPKTARNYRRPDHWYSACGADVDRVVLELPSTGGDTSFTLRIGSVKFDNSHPYVNGYVSDAALSGQKPDATRGEIFYVSAGNRNGWKAGKGTGVGTRLMLDALRLMAANGAKTVVISRRISESGKRLVGRLVREGYISGAIAESESGATEHRIDALKIETYRGEVF